MLVLTPVACHLTAQTGAMDGVHAFKQELFQ